MSAVKWMVVMLMGLQVVPVLGGMNLKFDDFSTEHDYTSSLEGTIWDGVFISPETEGITPVLVRANSIDEPGSLALQSELTNNIRYVLLYIEVPADTDFEVITRLDGGNFNEIGEFIAWHSSGLMVKHPTDHLNWIANLYFSNPQWEATFIGRKLTDGAEENQNTGAEGTNVDELPWSKLAREGNDFVLSYSEDGIEWVEFARHQHEGLVGTSLHVGLTHQMHADGNTATAYFGEFTFVPEGGGDSLTAPHTAGFIRVPLTAGQWDLVGLPFNQVSDEKVALADVLGTVGFVNGTEVMAWDGTGYAAASYFLGTWSGNIELRRGQGFWIKTPVDTDLYLLGQVPSEEETAINLSRGLQLISAPYPAASDLNDEDVLLSVPFNGDQIFFLGDGPGYTSNAYFLGTWSGAGVLEPGKGYWYDSVDEQEMLLGKPY